MLPDVHYGLQIKCSDLITKNHPQILQVVTYLMGGKYINYIFF